ncbi:MAG TPA: hypothetical protein DIS94_04465 [Bacteroidetes bacterium]|nr:hypothetical protein [Bacteroidota bacterium]
MNLLYLFLSDITEMKQNNTAKNMFGIAFELSIPPNKVISSNTGIKIAIEYNKKYSFRVNLNIRIKIARKIIISEKYSLLSAVPIVKF